MLTRPAEVQLDRSTLSPRLSPFRSLLLVGALFVLAQLVLLTSTRGLENDEAVYLSQVSRTAVAAPWEAHRAWGVPLLLLPVGALPFSVVLLRVYLAVLSGVALVVAFHPWLTVLPRWTATVAALLFAGSWITLFSGSEASPNLWVAFAATATLGWLARLLWLGGGPPAAVAVVAGAAVTALMRPSDSLWLLAPGVVAALLASRDRRRTGAAALIAGQAVGWAPWLVEAALRFGGPVQRLAAAEAAVGGGDGLHNTLFLHLRLLRGARICCFGPDRVPHVPLPGLLWWTALAVLTLVGLVVVPRGAARRAALLACASAGVLGLSYVVGTGFAASRFLLPSYALLDLLAAAALVAWLQAARRRPPAARLLLVLPLVAASTAYAVWNVRVVRTVDAAETASRDVVDVLAAATSARGLQPPCYVAGARGMAIAFHVGCSTHGVGRTEQLRDRAAAERHVAAGERVTVVARGALPPDSFLRSWRALPLTEVRPAGWVMYVPPGATWVRQR